MSHLSSSKAYLEDGTKTTIKAWLSQLNVTGLYSFIKWWVDSLWSRVGVDFVVFWSEGANVEAWVSITNKGH